MVYKNNMQSKALETAHTEKHNLYSCDSNEKQQKKQSHHRIRVLILTALRRNSIKRRSAEHMKSYFIICISWECWTSHYERRSRERVGWGWRWVKGVIYFHSVSKEFNSSSNRTDLPNTLPAPPWQAKKITGENPSCITIFLCNIKIKWWSNKATRH